MNTDRNIDYGITLLRVSLGVMLLAYLIVIAVQIAVTMVATRSD